MSIKGRVEVGDRLWDWQGRNWCVLRVERSPSNAHVTIQDANLKTKTIWENTMRARASRWMRLRGDVQNVCLKITTFQGMSPRATHYYCGMVDYDAEEDIVERVSYLLTIRDAERVNRADGLDEGRLGAYRIGDRCERFPTRDAAISAGVREVRRRHGAGVKIYLGDRTRALEDMEEVG